MMLARGITSIAAVRTTPARPPVRTFPSLPLRDLFGGAGVLRTAYSGRAVLCGNQDVGTAETTKSIAQYEKGKTGARKTG